MLTPAEARALVLERVQRRSLEEGIEEVPLAEAAGRVLARPAVSDVDVPPFEKSMMDGFALRAADLAEPGQSLACVGESRAGAPFDGDLPPGACIEIYTGAELPAACDAVQMVELTRREGDRVVFVEAVASGRHVSHRAEILGEGRTVFEPRRRLTAADLSVLASIGLDPVPVVPRPRVSVLTTGDELVPPTERPGRGQIREGNTLYLAAAVGALGCSVRRAGIVRDDPEELEAAFREALDEGDALVTTGGVSVGKYDLVGTTFERIGVEPVLHKVAIKPGKPIWFGMLGPKPVFGLPGNPVSSLLGFEVFVRPALARLAGARAEEDAERVHVGRWQGREMRASGRQHNLPARVLATAGEDGVDLVEPVPFRGSADVVSASLADALVIVPAEGAIRNGDLVSYRPLR
jgi:molybdopterin molybdotransferase